MPQWPRQVWTPAEEAALKEGVAMYGHKSNRWRMISDDQQFAKRLEGRTNINLKDKWRGMVRNNPALGLFTVKDDSIVETGDGAAPPSPAPGQAGMPVASALTHQTKRRKLQGKGKARKGKGKKGR